MTNPGLLTQVLDLQALMVQQGALPAIAHDVADGRFCPDGDVLIECTCGRGEYSADEASSKRRYALHVVRALGLPIRTAAGR